MLTYITICTYTKVLTTINNMPNPAPTTKPRATPRNTVAKNVTIHMNCTLRKTIFFNFN